MAEVNRAWSPYNYVKNNPVRLIDPDGMEDDNINDVSNTDIGNDDDKHHNGNWNTGSTLSGLPALDIGIREYSHSGTDNDQDDKSYLNRQFDFEPHYFAGGDGGGKKNDGNGTERSNGTDPSKDKKLTTGGNVYQKPKNGKGPGEPIGYNLNDNMVSHQDNYVAPGNHPSVSPVAVGAGVGAVIIAIFRILVGFGALMKIEY